MLGTLGAAAPVTIAMFRRQYERNLIGLRAMVVAARACAPRKYRGYTLAQCEANVANFESIVALSDAEMVAHLRAVRS